MDEKLRKAGVILRTSDDKQARREAAALLGKAKKRPKGNQE